MRSVDPATLDPRVRDLPVLVLDDVEGGLRMRFRAIPAGRCVMGSRGYLSSEEPQHTVVIPPIPGREDGVAFWLAETPVTQRQFRVWTQSRSYSAWRKKAGQEKTHSNYFKDRQEAPAENLDWFAANGYCEWLGSRRWSREARAVLGDTSVQFGLPLETEWEYACRAGSDTEYWSGDGDAALAEVGWFGPDWESGTLTVGELPANGFGLFDMHGNVWEWCLDPWEEHPYRDRPPLHEHHPAAARESLAKGEGGPLFRVFRGGAFFGSAGGCRSAYRLRSTPVLRDGGLGFRVCLFPGPVVQPSQQSSEGEGGASARREGAQRARPSRSAPPDEGLDSQHLPRIPRP
jgi:formylglycine-generating enzyme required for sulfatase activity